MHPWLLRYVVVALALLVVNLSYAQDEEVDTTAKRLPGKWDTSTTAKRQFIYFQIPVVINGSKMDPSPVNALSFEAKDTKFEVKVGFTDRCISKKKHYRFTFTAVPYIKASSGKSSLFAAEEWGKEYGASLGLNYFPAQRKWTSTGYGASNLNLREARRVDRRSHWKEAYSPRTWAAKDTISEMVLWFTGRLEMNRTTDKLFARSGAGLDTLVGRELGLGVFYLSGNLFFHSELGSFRWRNAVFSAGVGTGSFTNVADLKKSTLSEGTVVYNADSTAFTSVTKTSEGYQGTLVVHRGPSAYAEAYWPRIPVDYNGGTLSWGNRVTWFDAATADPNWRVSSGLYFNGKSKDGAKTNDKFSFAITANFDRFQDRAEEEYIKDHFVLQLSASVPLVFN